MPSPKTLTELWLIRHGRSVWNELGRYQGQTDIELSDEGHQQAERLAERLTGETFSALYSSDLKRALHTAEIVASRLKPTLSVQPLSTLREIKAGTLTGLTNDEIRQQFPEYVQQLNTDAWHTQRPEGESMEQLYRRIGPALQQICQQQHAQPSEPHEPHEPPKKHSRKRVLVVTHGGVIRTGVMYALGLADTAALCCARLHTSNTSITRILLSEDPSFQGTLLSFNDVSHLEQ